MPGPVKPHVAEHYATLGIDALIAVVERHYRDTVGPLVMALVAERVEQAELPGYGPPAWHTESFRLSGRCLCGGRR